MPNSTTRDKAASRTRRKALPKKAPSGRLRFWLAASAAILILSGLTAGGYHFAYHSDVFDIRTIEVSGNLLLDEGYLVQRTGIAEGDNLWRVSLRGAVAALEADPWVKSAAVSRLYPDGIALHVQERQPLAWCGEGDLRNEWAVDRTGVLLSMRRLGLPARSAAADMVIDATLTGLNLTANGGPFAGHVVGPPALHALLAAWGQGGVFDAIGEIRCATGGVEVIPRDRFREIRLGRDEAALRIGALDAFWRFAQQEDLRGDYVDFRFPRQGVVAKLDELSEARMNRFRSRT